MTATKSVLYYDAIDWSSGLRLDQLQSLIEKMQRKYGKRATIRFDAGYNSVTAVVEPTKKQK